MDQHTHQLSEFHRCKWKLRRLKTKSKSARNTTKQQCDSWTGNPVVVNFQSQATFIV